MKKKFASLTASLALTLSYPEKVLRQAILILIKYNVTLSCA